MQVEEALFRQLLRLGDDCLVLGHRVSEWCGHAPMVEEDMAMPNMSLDLIGQARAIYTLAGEVEGKGRSEDDFAYLREERAFRNCLLVERPNGDFAHTMLKQLYFAAFMTPYWQAACKSRDARLAGIAGKAVKEMAYHVRHAGEWVIRLGDGTAESARRMAEAVADLHPYTDELFAADEVTDTLRDAGVAPDPDSLRAAWTRTVAGIFEAAKLETPEIRWPMSGGREGLHGEELGHLLCELQYVARAHPGANW